MKHTSSSNRSKHVLSMLGRIPRWIIAHHNITELQAFVLHCLCGSLCFDVSRAAYLLNNRDFDQLQGIAGFSQEEGKGHTVTSDKIESFTTLLQESPYHQHVVNQAWPSLVFEDVHGAKELEEVARELGFEKYTLCSWKTRFDNDGILLLDQREPLDADVQQVLNDALCLVGLCPTY